MYHGIDRPFADAPSTSASIESRCARPQRQTFNKIHYDSVIRQVATPDEFSMQLLVAKPGDTIKATSLFTVKEPIICRVPDLRIVGPIRISSHAADGASVTVQERTFFENVTIDSLSNIGVKIVSGDVVFVGCSLSGEQGGVEQIVRSHLKFQRCNLNGAQLGFGLNMCTRGTCEMEDCNVNSNGRGGINLSDGSTIWMSKNTISQNRQFGIAFNRGSSGQLIQCDIYGNSTQGVFAGPESSPIIWKSTIHDNKASGVKVWGHCVAEECIFQNNADRDIDIVGGEAHLACSRFRGGPSQAVVVTGKDASVTIRHCCFDQYTVWAMSAQEGARVRLERNFFNTAIDFNQPTPLDGSAGGSGLLLQHNVRGSAKENAFVGWRRGYVRSRVAYHINRCPLFKQIGASDGIVELETLRQESGAVYDELMEIVAQNPEHFEIDLSAARLQRKRRSSASSSSSEDPTRKRQIDAETIENVLPILQCDAVARQLNLSGNRQIGDEGVRHLATAISSHPELKSVNFSRVGMSDASLKQFCQAATSVPKLQSIDLSDNDLTMESMPIVTQLLRENRNIHRFNLEGNKRIAHEAQEDVDFLCSANAFASAKVRDQLITLHQGQELVCADLSGQVIQTSTAQTEASWPDASHMINVMCYSMRLNKWITTLHIDTNQMDDTALAALGAFLRDSTVAPKLETLSISGNNVRDISPLVNAITTSGRVIRALDLSNNQLTGKKNAQALRSLLGTSNLNHLNVATNFFTKNDIDCLVFSLPPGVRVRSEGQQPLPTMPEPCTTPLAPPSDSACAWETSIDDNEKRSTTPAAGKRRMRVPQVFPLRNAAALEQ